MSKPQKAILIEEAEKPNSKSESIPPPKPKVLEVEEQITMPNPAFANFISRTGQASKTQLDQIGTLSQLDVLWAGAADYDALITQAEIDEFPSFVAAGLTAAQLGDALFALATIRNTINNALPALTMLANLP